MDFWGFFIIMEMPKLINGLEKSITSSRTRVMVRGATAISALWKQAQAQRPLVLTCTKKYLIITYTFVRRLGLQEIKRFTDRKCRVTFTQGFWKIKMKKINKSSLNSC